MEKINEQDSDNQLILSAIQDPEKPEIPRNDEVNDGYDPAEDTGNNSEYLDPDDDTDTNLDDGDLNALGGLDEDDDETMS